MEQHKNNKKIPPKCKRKNSRSEAPIPSADKSAERDKESTPTEEGERVEEIRVAEDEERREWREKRDHEEEKT